MPLVIVASITGPLVNLATHLIRTLGLAGVFALTAITGVIGVPGTEPTMLFAGFNVFDGHLSMIGIIVCGAAGDMLGACIAYAIGYFGSRELLERHGRRLHVDAKGLDRAQRWFERRGAPVMFVSRNLPLVRAVFPYAAGVGRMAFVPFFAFSLLGSLVWMTVLGEIGRAVGRSWPTWRHHLEYVDYAAAAVLLLVIVVWLARWWRGRTAQPASARADVEPADAVSP